MAVSDKADIVVDRAVVMARALEKTPGQLRKRDVTATSTIVSEAGEPSSEALDLGELNGLLGYSLKRAQLRIFDDFLRCVAPVKLTPAQFSVLLLMDRNPGRNQTEIANTLGILRPNFVAMLDALETRGLCTRERSPSDRRSHVLMLTDKGRTTLAKAKKLVADKHEARLVEVLGPREHRAMLEMVAKLAKEL